jgi:hypothetical protein
MSNETTVPEQPKHEAPPERTKGRKTFAIRSQGLPYLRFCNDEAEAKAIAKELTRLNKREFTVSST